MHGAQATLFTLVGVWCLQLEDVTAIVVARIAEIFFELPAL
jgi:hypothetical protein